MVECAGMDYPVHRGDTMALGLHDRYCAMYVIFFLSHCLLLLIYISLILQKMSCIVRGEFFVCEPPVGRRHEGNARISGR